VHKVKSYRFEVAFAKAIEQNVKTNALFFAIEHVEAELAIAYLNRRGNKHLQGKNNNKSNSKSKKNEKR
jgi:hypothetical protein